MNFKTRIKQKIYRPAVVKNLCSLSLLLFRIKSVLGIRTRGLTSFQSLALNKILEKLPKGLFTIGIIREVDFSDSELKRLQNWSLKNPENHISLFLQPDNRVGKLIIGKNWTAKINPIDAEVKLVEANLLFKDEQFLKGVEYLVNFISIKL